MRGHHKLISMRNKGKCPSTIWIDTDIDYLKCWSDWHIHNPWMAYIQIDSTDKIELSDFRFVIGINVIIIGKENDIVVAVANSCIECKASRVIAIVYERINNDCYQEVVIDTDGFWKNGKHHSRRY